MKPQEQFQIIFGSIMVGVYLFGGIFVIIYTKEIYPDKKMLSILGWVMIAYSLLRAIRVYEVMKKRTTDNKPKSGFRKP